MGRFLMLFDRTFVVFLEPSVFLLIGRVREIMAPGHTMVHLCNALDFFGGARFWEMPEHQRIYGWDPQQVHRLISELWEYF